MKRLWCVALLLLSACVGKPPVAVAPVPPPPPAPATPVTPPPSRISVLDNSVGYVGDCFAGYFRPKTQFKADGGIAWVFVDPLDKTGEIQFDAHHLILKQIDRSGDPEKGIAKDRFVSADGLLTVEISYRQTAIDQDGTRTLNGTLTAQTAHWMETFPVSGQESC